ncbi:EVE domain-containing protein isoform 2 [Cladophialophora immunda]|nr:EVE domain-containing protein isoform 2 [Cladophialophora immunda]
MHPTRLPQLFFRPSIRSLFTRFRSRRVRLLNTFLPLLLCLPNGLDIETAHTQPLFLCPETFPLPLRVKSDIMPAKKRKASSNSSTPAKKVRIGGTSAIPDQPAVSSAGRPKRTTNTAPAGSSAKGEPVKKRGRPPKAAASPAPKRDVKPKPVKSSVKKTTTSNASKPVTSSRTARAATRKSPAKAPAPTTTAKRGRKPKVAPKTKNASSESESEDGPSPHGHAPGAINGDGNKSGETATLDHDIQYWLMKAEPESRIEKGHDVKFSIDDLAAKTEPEGWDGVRNPVARNNMRAMRKGDLAFFYHSNCAIPGIAGVMRIVGEHTIDESAFDPGHPYFDPKSDRAKPKWELVHVEFVKKFENLITLKELKSFAKPGGALENMQTFKQSRLSVSAVSAEEWRFILDLAGESVSLGHGDVMGGYESEVDGEGEETVGTGDGDGLNGLSDGATGLGITGAIDGDVSDQNDTPNNDGAVPVNGAGEV